MKEKGLVNFFETYIQKQPLFKDKNALQSNYTPEHISHRDEQIQQIANILAPALREDKPSNIFIFGKTGSGKTLTVRYTAQQLCAVAQQKKIPLKIIYLNCKLKKLADTEYRLVAQLLREYGREIPPTGLPTDEVYHIFFNTIDKEKHNLILILDEVDQLVGKAGDELLYNLTRINSELKNAKITLIGISNDLVFTDQLDPRVKSSLSEEELIFPPYNALQIQDILQQRASQAFRPETLDEGLTEKCAAYAAREHGDARRALELLRVAAELAERDNSTKVHIKHLDHAEEKIERDRVLDIVAAQPKQFQAALLAIIDSCQQKNGVFTGDIYQLYEKYCDIAGLRPLTQRRISDVIAELDMLGIINAKVISKGRYGRTREITLGTNDAITQKVKSILSEELGLTWNTS
ncbi:ORC1-type DNA replication protein [Candidatus Woesearchaeota archaeon]|nr:ORC1-type DNA replication protein [Candidatus Woesearchaeota archaeon]